MPLTLDDVEKAAEFNSGLCQPIVEALNAFSRELSPAETFMVAEAFSDSYYLPPKSPVLEYLGRTLRNFKGRLTTLVKPYYLDSFDRAIEFFERQRQNGKAVRLNCNDEPIVSTEMFHIDNILNPLFDSKSLQELLRKKFGLPVLSETEYFPSHQIVYANVKPESSDLILVIADAHNVPYVTHARLNLIDYLVRNLPAARIVMGQETSERELREFQAYKKPEELELVRKKWKSGMMMPEMFMKFVDPQMAKRSCTAYLKKDPETTMETCMMQIFLPNVANTIVFAIIDKAADWWAMEDEKMRDKFDRTKNELRRGSNSFELQPEYDSLIKERSKIMSANFVKKMKEESSHEGKRVVIVEVGALHFNDFIAHLPNDLNASVVGLISPFVQDALFKAAKKE